MSSWWKIVIWSNSPSRLMSVLNEYAENHERGAQFYRPHEGNGALGAVDVITGEANHLDPADLLDVIRDAHQSPWGFDSVTVLLSNEYDLGDLPTVHRLTSEGYWRR